MFAVGPDNFPALTVSSICSIRLAVRNIAIKTWDSDEDGVLAGPQENTLDGKLGGSSSWIGSLYLAALDASEKMAKLEGDGIAAERYRRIRQSGAKKQNEMLWNGEYYIQIPDLKPREDYNNGCHIDQVLGEWWASQLGLGPYYPKARIRRAMQSLVKYNFLPNFRNFKWRARKFVDKNDPGTLMITWPKGDRPDNHIRYADEVWTGTEYAAAATMIQNGLLKEGLMIVRAVYDRSDGRQRRNIQYEGHSGNPFSDDESGKFYARAMSVWSVLLACQGFIYDGPAGVIGFKPVWKPQDHVSFFTAAQGWGLFTQNRSEHTQTEQIELKYGQLKVARLLFELAEGERPVSVSALVDNRQVPVSFVFDARQLQVILKQPIILQADSPLQVNVKIK